MGKDYRIGLASGLAVAVIALVWVATRPSLSPEARMPRPSQATPLNPGVGFADRQPAETSPDRPASGTPSPPGNVAGSTASDRRAAAPAPQSDGGPDLTIYEKTEKIKTTRFHIVRRDETLSAISQQYYGTPNKWPKIVEANKAVVKDPSKLQPGTKLIIPE
ncbi:MAG: LysM peptidoglycan-binding domain-containing protein [Sedimentisphaerales bacterium]|nr:LysM peptidoglycan-binding domain-containing protein [Sedimentisphaerales bacterium]